MSFNVTALDQEPIDEDSPLLQRNVRPTGHLKTCYDCGTFITVGFRCLDCWHDRQRAKLGELGIQFKKGQRSLYRRFTDDEIRDIRSTGRSSVKYVKELCQKYNANPKTIYGILAGDTYKDVK
jgi:hypothetical protein